MKSQSAQALRRDFLAGLPDPVGVKGGGNHSGGSVRRWQSPRCFILPVLQLNLRFDHDVIVAKNDIMSTPGRNVGVEFLMLRGDIGPSSGGERSEVVSG